MIDPMITQAALIASALTKASRRALVRIARNGWTDEGSPGPARQDVYSLWWGRDHKYGLVDRPQSYAWSALTVSWRWRLTPLGRKVRAHLISEGDRL